MDGFIRAIYPGSFDPVTYGHLDIIMRASALFDEVIVAVGENPGKIHTFSKTERVDFLKRSLEENGDLNNVTVVSFDKLLVDYAKQNQVKVIVRGLRAITDFEREFQMALANMDMAPGIETVFLITKPRSMPVSSSLVKEIASYGGDVQKYTTSEVNCALKKKYAKKNEG
jgi:pantetheine-phosphate adenylyltransferase